MLIVALDDDFAVFGAATDTAFVFQGLAEQLQVVVCADKSSDECDGFPTTAVAVDSDFELLSVWREGLLLGWVVVLVLEVGVCRKDYTDSVF